jgi:nucleoside-diphosphate-sugar epimerase
MKVFVTGAAGFLGSQVMRQLIAAGHETLALVAPESDLWRLDGVVDRVRLIRGTLQEIDSWRAEPRAWKPQACIHLAWTSRAGADLDSPQHIESLQGSLALLQALPAWGCEYILSVGSCAEYRPKSGLLTEADPPGPESLYAVAKHSLHLFGQRIAERAGIRFAWGRIFYAYGPYEDPRRLIPAAILSLRQGVSFPATAGEQVRDYLHAQDVSRALLALLEAGAAGTFNICSSNPVAVRDLLEMIGDLLGRTQLIQFGALPYRDWEPAYLGGDNSRLRALGWSPSLDLRSGLRQVIEWWAGAARTVP